MQVLGPSSGFLKAKIFVGDFNVLEARLAARAPEGEAVRIGHGRAELYIRNPSRLQCSNHSVARLLQRLSGRAALELGGKVEQVEGVEQIALRKGLRPRAGVENSNVSLMAQTIERLNEGLEGAANGICGAEGGQCARMLIRAIPVTDLETLNRPLASSMAFTELELARRNRAWML